MALAARLASHDEIGSALIELRGPLGAGKTAFVRHLLRALGVEGRIKSPTFTLVEAYQIESDRRRFSAAHCDFYRFGDPHEWVDAGLRDVFAEPGLKLVEWPEKAAALLPAADLRIAIEPLDETSRSVVVDALTPLGVGLLR